jgi:hypothetical protein
MPTWLEFVVGYAAYLTVVAWSFRRFARARIPALAVLGASLALALAWPQVETAPAPFGVVAWVAVPGLFVLATYRVSGAFFVAPNLALERWLLRVDATTLIDSGLLRAYSGVKAMRSIFELLYLLVYAMVPVGAAVLAIAGRADWLPRYWAVVFAAELTCYATLPWLQTRPPRTVETAPLTASVDALRQLNLVVLERGSIQVNTLPSAHAAGAIALALVIMEALTAIGGVFLAIAIGITVATVLGRYHYLVDAVLGVIVAAVAWLVVG